MNIQVNDDYRITLDKYSWEVAQRNVPKKGKNAGVEEWRGVSWHRTITQACNWLTERLISDESVKDYKSAIDSAAEKIARAINESKIPDSWLDAKSVGLK